MANAPLTPEERLARLEAVYEHLATKTDIANLKTDIAKLKTDMAEFKTDIANLKTDMAELEGRLTAELHKGLNRNLYITIGAVVAVATLVKYLP